MNMSKQRRFAGVCALSAVGAALVAPIPAVAQQASDDWQYAATIYAWLPDISGDTAFGVGGGQSFEIPVGTILDNLNMTGQVAFEARKGSWGAFTDIIYMDVGASASRTRDMSFNGQPLPASVTASLKLDSKSTIWTLGGSYRVLADPQATFDVLAGARLLDLKQGLRWRLTGDFGETTPPPLSGHRDESVSSWDAIVGAKGRFAFGNGGKWSVPYYLDIGAGNSDLTWQGVVGVTYAFGWGDLGVVWRYLDYQMGSGKAVDNANFNGPALGATFRW
jgi:hypothetical protein